MDNKKLYLAFAVYVGSLFSICLFADPSVETIKILDTENISKSYVEPYRQTVLADERETHCQIGQLFLDGKHIEKDYEAAFFHLFLCGKTYSWPGGGKGGGQNMIHTTYKQFIPVFKNDGIQPTLETARDKALIHSQNSGLSDYESGNVQSRIKRGFAKAMKAHSRVSTRKTYRDLIVLNVILFLILLIASPPNIRR